MSDQVICEECSPASGLAAIRAVGNIGARSWQRVERFDERRDHVLTLGTERERQGDLQPLVAAGRALVCRILYVSPIASP